MDPMHLKWCLKVLMFLIFVWRASNGLEGCQQPMEIGKPQVFRHTQKLDNVTTLKWNVTQQYGNVELSCVVSNQSCSYLSNSNFNIIGNITQQSDQTTTFLTILNTTYDIRSVRISYENWTVIDTCSLELFARPAEVTCNTLALSSDKTGIDVRCSAIKMYPDNATLILYTQNNVYINTTIHLKPSITIPGYYYMDDTYPVPASMLIRGNNTFFMSIYPSVTNGQTFAVNSSTVWILLNQSYSAIYVYPSKSSIEFDATLNASLTIICSAYPIPAPRISLTRRSSGLELNSTENSRLLTFTLTSFNCLDTDEYVCLVDNWSPDVPNATSSIGIYGSSCGVQLQADQSNQQKIEVKPGSDVLVSIQLMSRDNPTKPVLTRYVGGDVYSVPEAFYSTQYISTSKYYGKLNLALYHVTEDELSDYTVSINKVILYNFTLIDESSINYQNVAIGVGVAAIGVICVTIVFALVCYYRNVRPSRLRSEDTRLTAYDVRETSTNYKEDYLEPTVNRPNTNSDSADDSVYTDNNGLHKFGDQGSKPRQNVYHHSPNRIRSSSGVVEPGEMYGNVLTPGDTSPVNDTDQPVYSNM